MRGFAVSLGFSRPTLFPIKTLTQLLKTVIPRRAKTAYRRQREKKELRIWQESGQPAPPPHIVKQLAIRSYLPDFPYGVLVETGTFRGAMVEAQLPYFERIYSIELGKELYEQAKTRFRRDRGVQILQGDSGLVLRELVPQLREPAIFWLDGHYSGGVTALGAKVSPVMEEITTILSTTYPHVLLIDDARLFTGQGGYPTLEEVVTLVAHLRPDYTFAQDSDSLRFTPPIR